MQQFAMRQSKSEKETARTQQKGQDKTMRKRLKADLQDGLVWSVAKRDMVK